MIKRELQIFFTALTFYTRIPCYKLCNYSAEYINNATKYFPLIGWIVGGIGALVFMVFSYILPEHIAVLLSMISTILLTGAFHEDGFADFCDGFGGGMKKDQILKIMKDSRIGSYALIGMICILGLKYSSLTAISPKMLPIILVTGHSLSRFIGGSFIFTHEYVRKNDNTAKSLETTEGYPLSVIIPYTVFGFIPLFLLGTNFLLILIPLFITRQIFSVYLQKKIGGYTGDCLGAIQQISEVVFYIFIVIAPWKYI